MLHGEQHNHHLPDLAVLLYGCETSRMTKSDGEFCHMLKKLEFNEMN